MSEQYAPNLVDQEEQDSLDISAVRFSRTPLGRVVLHLECLCHHPAAARFHLSGLTRNLRELLESIKRAAFKSLKKLRPSIGC
jgi:hypothetical protein